MGKTDVRHLKAPFPHIVIENFIDEKTLKAINDEWPEEGWTQSNGKSSIKWHTQKLPPAAARIANSQYVLDLVKSLTGIDDLFTDPELLGAGLHCIPTGGYLGMHVDFNRHPKGWQRKVNFLLYLNQEWQTEWNGHLQLGIRQPVRIEPVGGRAVIFITNDNSWHGHPEPLNCPDGVQRRSLALYFYTNEKPTRSRRTTLYDNKKNRQLLREAGLPVPK